MTEKLPVPVPRATPTTTRASKPLQVTGRLRDALNLMVYGNEKGEPLEYDQAAAAVGLTTRGMRLALAKNHVRRYLREQRAILLASLTATNPHHVAKLRATSSNQMTRLQAAKLIEEMAGEATSQSAARPMAPGITIVLAAPPAARPKMAIVDVAPEQPKD